MIYNRNPIFTRDIFHFFIVFRFDYLFVYNLLKYYRFYFTSFYIRIFFSFILAVFFFFYITNKHSLDVISAVVLYTYEIHANYNDDHRNRIKRFLMPIIIAHSQITKSKKNWIICCKIQIESKIPKIKSKIIVKLSKQINKEKERKKNSKKNSHFNSLHLI